MSGLSCDGEIVWLRTVVSKPVACKYRGRVLTSTDGAIGLGNSAETETPVLKPTGTVKSGLLAPYTLIPGNPVADFPRFQPEFVSTVSISLSSFIDSSSWKTERKTYSVPLNGVRTKVNSDTLVNDLGVFIRSNSAVAAAACLSASARCDSADAACVFAVTMSCSKLSASLRALLARADALLASPLALEDVPAAAAASETARPAASDAPFAEASASPARCSAATVCLWSNSVKTLPASENFPQKPIHRLRRTRPATTQSLRQRQTIQALL